LYQITTLYNRSVTVTSSHSVFAFENERVLLKKGNEIRRGDLVVCPKRLPRVESLQKEIDLLALFGRDDLSQDLYAHGESVRRIAAARLLAKVRRPELWSEPRVALNEKVWGELAAHRAAAGITQLEVAKSLGVKQPITVCHWENRVNRPIRPHFE